MKFLPVTAVGDGGSPEQVTDAAEADTILFYAAGGPVSMFRHFAKQGKDVVFFLRHKSGPVYLWYEIVSPRLIRNHTDICRAQIDIRFRCDSLQLAQRMVGFHWMTCYGDYQRELGYALKKVGITWEFLG